MSIKPIKASKVCRCCGRPIGFLRSKLTGQWLPVDPEPISWREDPLGVPIITAQGKVCRGRVVDPPGDGGRLRRGWLLHDF